MTIPMIPTMPTDVLIAASDLRITPQEVNAMLMGTITSAITAMLLVYMIHSFGAGLGLQESAVRKYELAVKRL